MSVIHTRLRFVKLSMHVDIIIVGGGMIGAASALALSSIGLKVALIEAKTPIDFTPEQQIDSQVCALYPNTVRFLQHLGAWPHIVGMRACPFFEMHIGHEQQTLLHFHRRDIAAQQLGFFVENRIIQLGLWQQLKADNDIIWFTDASLQRIEQLSDYIQVQLGSGHVIQAYYLLGCDGMNSRVRQITHMGCTRWMYQQHCSVVTVATPTQHHTTWQHFTATGPRAFLPLTEQHAALICYDKPQVIRALAQDSDSELKQKLTRLFPQQLPDFKIKKRATFPLAHMHAHQYHKGRIALLGDAAHHMHPMTGQGVNFGFKDVQTLQQLAAQHLPKQHWRTSKWLATYANRRRCDNVLMQSFMNALHLAATQKNAALLPIGLRTTQQQTWLKSAFRRYFFGL